MKVKTKLFAGKTINLKEVEEKDAEFIFELRTDPELNQYLSTVGEGIEQQREFIRNYQKKTNECYFVIESKQGEPYGLYRIYNVTEDSFVPGSWIIKKSAPVHIGIESVLLLYEYAFHSLGLKTAKIDVRKGNNKVIAFHKRFGAVPVGEDEFNVYLDLSLSQYEITRKKYLKYIPEFAQ
ncbi:MAG TPA: GNAT family N-acetyltransferase [Candidatus Gastranaerophilales bacterium]|nr:GNAT family N-acetyltransferase [Candidatus Gastranaerophilales bacterium]